MSAHELPQLERVVQPVHARVFGELFVKDVDGREEDDRVHVVKVGWPLGALESEYGLIRI